MLDRSISWAKHCVTAWLKGFMILPRYSPIICFERPFLVIKNLATACAELSRKPFPKEIDSFCREQTYKKYLSIPIKY